MGLGALLVTLLAAAVHAGWNALLAGSRDTSAATAVALLVGAVVFLPVAVLTWDVSAAVWPYAVASVALELLYVVLLAAAYARADMSVVYPVARGSAPVLVLAASGLPGVRQAVGVLTVVAGIVAVRAGGSRRAGRAVADGEAAETDGTSAVPARAVADGGQASGSDGTSGGGAPVRDLGLALCVGACIAGYTLVDAAGLDHAGPLPYLWLVIAPVGVLHAAGLALRPGGVARLRCAVSPAAAVAGVGFFGAYALVLVALTLAPAAAVAAVRETSVVFAVGLAAVMLGEPVGRMRVLGAAVVAAGIALVAL